jgi:hypothetical protein
VIHEYLQYRDHLQGLHNVVIPIRSGDHWVGIRLVVEGGAIQRVVFYNSSSANERYQNLMRAIKDELRNANLIAAEVEVSYSKHCLQQQDSTSCGAFLIENIYCDLANLWWWPEGQGTDRVVPPEQFDYAETFRNKHVEILESIL